MCPTFAYGLAEADAWYLVRWPDRHYALYRVTTPFGHPLIAVHPALATPFPGDCGAIYLADYDAKKATAHNTAWIARAAWPAAIGSAR